MKPSIACALLVALVSSEAGAGARREVSESHNEAAAGYRIGVQDVLQISVFGNEALSRTVPVRPDGMISLPLLNDVKAAGLTPMELREALTKRLVEFVPSPEIAVIVTEVRSFVISVVGQVMKPGRYDLKSAATVVDALALAGGFKEFAGRSRVQVIRPEAGGQKRIPFDYDKMFSTSGAPGNFTLRPGDIVMVP